MKFSKTWIVIIAIILIVAGYYISKAVFKNPIDSLIIEKVQKGDVLQEISETGSVKATENISLGFKSIGKIARVDVAVGDSVKKGKILAELDSGQISAQLQSARAALDSAVTQYNKLINGLTSEDLKTYENAVTSAKQDLSNTYDEALNTLNSAYSSVYDAYTLTVSINDTYFSTADQQGIRVSGAKTDINNNMQNIKNNDNVDSAISRMLVVLDNVFNDLKIIREQCDQGIYYSSVSTADKTLLDTQKTYINTASANVITLQNSISSYKIALQKSQDNLSSKTANARPEDIDIYQSEIKQAQANVDALLSQSNDNYLISPIDGTVTEVNIKNGQVASVSQPAINLLSSEPFQIKVAIYEQDVINVKIGDGVKINLVAFPRQSFDGKVLLINPAETIIDNVVYYEVTIEFPNQPDGIKSGMTADIIIQANKKADVLRIPKNAAVQINGVETVEVVKGNGFENRAITTGLEGNDYVEVLSGLNEGEEIVIGKK